MKPSPEHELLQRETGTWECDITMYLQGPGGPATKSKGEETAKMLGDFWSMSTITYDFMGQPTSGHALMGYDPTKKKYVGTWYESGSPYQSTMEGTYDKEKKELTMMLSSVGMDGQPETYKSVTKYIDDDHKTFTMYTKMPDGGDEMVKMIVMEYTRKK